MNALSSFTPPLSAAPRRKRLANAWNGKARAAATVALAGACAGACSKRTPDPGDHTARVRQTLTTAESVLGFEDAAGWSSSSGTFGQSALATEGNAALAVSGVGYTELRSSPLSSLGTVGARMHVDLRVPEAQPNPHWQGDLQAVVSVPSRGVYHRWLGQRSLSGVSPGMYATLSFDLPDDLKNVLEGQYSDLEIKLILNVPFNTQPYLFDNLSLSPIASGADVVEMTVKLPAGRDAREILIAADGTLAVEARVELGAAGGSTVTANLGAEGTHLAAGTRTFGDVISRAEVFLGSEAVVAGAVVSEGDVIEQNDVMVGGGIQANGTVGVTPFSWQVSIPRTHQGGVALEPDESRELEPGAWGAVSVKSRAGLALTSGQYFFDSLMLEPEAELRLDMTAGPIVVHVEHGAILRGSLIDAGGEPGNLAIINRGLGSILLESEFRGTALNPRGSIELRRPPSGVHRGTFWGRRVAVSSDARVEHQPPPVAGEGGSLELGPAVGEDRYSGASPIHRAMLLNYGNARELTGDGAQEAFMGSLNQLRDNAVPISRIVKEELASASLGDRLWRYQLVEILAYLDRTFLLYDLEAIAGEPLPEVDDSEETHHEHPLAREESIRAMAVIGVHRLAELGSRSAKATLTGLIQSTNGFVRETAVLRYLSLGRTPERENEARGMLPENAQYLVDLELIDSDVPQPPTTIFGGN